MKRNTCWLAVGVMGVVTALAVAADPASWPKWLGPKGDGISTETGLLPSWPEAGPKKLWSMPVGKGYSTPVAQDGRVYLFSTKDKADVLTAFDADSGKELWSQSREGAWTGDYPGTRSTPTIEGDFIYTYGGAADLICRKLADGAQVWHQNVLKLVGGENLTWGVSSSPTVLGDLVIVQAGKGGPAVVAVNKKTGALAWKTQATAGGSYATVRPIDVAGKVQLVAFTAKGVVGIDPANGNAIWTVPWKTSYDVHASTPLYRDGMLFVTSGYDTGCMMVKVAGATATKLWQKPEPHSRFPAPILDGDCVYSNSEGTLMCTQWTDGRTLWSGDPKAMALGIGGSLLRADKDKLIVLTERGKLLLVQATPQAVKPISQFQMFRGAQVWSSPIIYKGRLYAKGEAELVCLDLRVTPTP